MMLDILGQELSIGDKVVVSYGGINDLVVGEILKFTPKMVKVKVNKSTRTIYSKQTILIKDIIKANPELFI